ncbi:MAG: hypothetical protein V1871_06760 [Planctomycetota bacterium]
MPYYRHSFFTPKSLFRRIRPDLLYNYFKSHKALDDFDWDSYVKDKWHLMEDLIDEFYKIPIKKREEIEGEFRQVNSLAGLSAQETLEAVAKQFKLLWDDEMMPEDRALTALMENKNAFLTACNWANLEDYESFADYVAKPKEPNEWAKIKQSMTDAWKLLLQNQNRGYGRVYIEHYTATDRQAYLVYYEAPSTYITRFDDQTDQPEEKSDKPVLESLLIYYPKLGKLKVKAKTDGFTETARDDYAKLALGDEHYFATGSERIYDMDQFKKKLEPIDFLTDPADRISSVKVVTLRFNPDVLTKDIIEINSVKGLKERIRLLKLDLTTAVIKKVRIQVKFEGVQKGLVKSFNLSSPNKNTLGDSKKDRLIEQYLVKWGIANR